MSNFTLDLTFSNDVLGEDSHLDVAVEAYDVGPSSQDINNISLQSHASEVVDASIFDQAFLEENDHDNTLNDDFPQSQNFLDYSTEEEHSSQVQIISHMIDNVDIRNAAAKEETSAGIISNSSTSVLMAQDEQTRVATFRRFSSSNHISFEVKLEKTLNEIQKANLERLLKAKMKSDVWMREEVERSQAFLRLYRIRQGDGDTFELEPIHDAPRERRVVFSAPQPQITPRKLRSHRNAQQQSDEEEDTEVEPVREANNRLTFSAPQRSAKTPRKPRTRRNAMRIDDDDEEEDAELEPAHVERLAFSAPQPSTTTPRKRKLRPRNGNVYYGENEEDEENERSAGPSSCPVGPSPAKRGRPRKIR